MCVSELMEEVNKPRPASSSSAAAAARANTTLNNACVNTSTNAATLSPRVSLYYQGQ